MLFCLTVLWLYKYEYSPDTLKTAKFNLFISITPSKPLTSPEYVILEDFNFTLGRLYPRYKSTPARFVPGVFVKSL